MSVTDPVADMLTRVRNACQAGHRRVDMPVSKLKVEIARLLRDNHYVQDYKVLDDGRHGLLRLYLKYHNDAPVIRELQRVSAPGLRRYVKAREIPRIKNGLGMAILATHAGGAGFAVGHQALRGREDGHAEAVLDPRDLARLDVAAKTGRRHPLQLADDGRVVVILEVEPQQAVLAVIQHLEVLDVGIVTEQPRDLGLQF